MSRMMFGFVKQKVSMLKLAYINGPFVLSGQEAMEIYAFNK